MAFSISYKYEVFDCYSAPLQKIAQATARFEQIAARAQSRVRNLGQRMEEAGSKMANFRSAIGAAGIVAGLKSVVSQSAAVEDAMADVKRVMDFKSEEGFAQFDDMLTKMSETMGRSKQALASIAYEGGKLGVGDGEMEGFIQMVTSAAISFDILESEAGRAIGSIRAKLGIGNDAIRGLLDSVNYLADSTSADGSHMIEIIERVSGKFANLQIPPNLAAGFAAFADQLETSPELAASGLKMVFNRMGRMPGMVDKMLTNPMGAFRDVMAKLAEMPEAERATLIFKMFGDEAGKFVESAVNKMELFDATMQKAVGNEAVGSMGREVENVQQRTSTAFARLRVMAENAMEDIGDAIAPEAEKAAVWVGKLLAQVRIFASEHPGIVKFTAAFLGLLAAIAGIGLVAGMFLSAAGSILTLVTGLWTLISVVGSFLIPVIFKLGLALLTTPIGWMIAGIAAVVAAGVWLYRNWDMVSKAMSAFGQRIKDDWQEIVDWFSAMMGKMGDMLPDWLKEKLGIQVEVSDDTLRAATGKLSKIPPVDVGVIAERAAAATTPGGPIPANVSTLAQTSATRESGASVNNVAVDGRIRVEAERGTRVTESSITLNRGQNLAYGN